MKAFAFRGARLLEWRRLQADQARGAFARATESARATAAVLDRAEEGSRRAERDSIAAMRGTTDVESLERHRNWIARQQEHERSCRSAHEEQLALVDRAAEALQVANRHVKVMERLRDRAARRHREAERQMEMKVIDELAAIRFVRRQVEGAARD